MTASATSQPTAQYLSFFIGDEEYCLGILESREIIQYPTVTKVPSMPPAIRGVINLRGSVVPVVDLAVLFGFPERPITKWTCVVVVEAQAQELVGIVVDSVSQVIELRAEDVEPPPAFGTQVKHHFLRGMGKLGKGFVLLLDLERVLHDVALEEVVAASPEDEAGVAAPPPEGETVVVESEESAT
jgi:purine-binding chemotaxis protein CheW